MKTTRPIVQAIAIVLASATVTSCAVHTYVTPAPRHYYYTSPYYYSNYYSPGYYSPGYYYPNYYVGVGYYPYHHRYYRRW